jgi:ABC-type molybdate transport system substrate-binding protein
VQRDAIFPPWQHGENNDATQRGLSFTVPEVDDLADFHGNVSDPKLVLYVGGNYFFAMAPLVKAFEQQHPGFRGRIYWETLPPGLLEKQIEAGGAVTSGNPEAARLWLSFIRSPAALSIFERYGFKPFTTAASAN